jgi:hypothetical protein
MPPADLDDNVLAVDAEAAVRVAAPLYYEASRLGAMRLGMTPPEWAALSSEAQTAACEIVRATVRGWMAAMLERGWVMFDPSMTQAIRRSNGKDN